MEEKKHDHPKDVNAENEEAAFENPSVDPGFETSDDELDGLEDERSENIDADENITDMQSPKQDDALNYKNDRENGAYNPKNI